MGHEDAGHYASKHPQGSKVDERISAAIWEKAVDGKLSCADAETIAGDLSISMGEVGRTADLMELRIHKCQLGLFGYGEGKAHGKKLEPAGSCDPDLGVEIREGVVDGKAPCKALWEIAKRRGMKRIDAAAACEFLKIKIKPCRLGAF